MRALAVQSYGGIEKLELMDLPVPEPAAGEVLVRIKAAGVNRVDAMYREGFAQTGPFPLVMGSDFAGIVEKVAGDVTSLATGQKVYGYKYRGNGTYAEYACVPANELAPMPQNITFEQAAALPCVGLIAYDAVINVLGVTSGQTVLITGASGGFGMFAIQLAKAQGVTVIAVGGSNSADFMRQFGSDHVLEAADDYATQVRAICPDGVDAALVAAAPTIPTVVSTIKDHGKLTWITGPAEVPMERMIAGGFTEGSRGTELLQALTHTVEAGDISQIIVERTYDLQSASQAMRAVNDGSVRGKLVVTI